MSATDTLASRRKFVKGPTGRPVVESIVVATHLLVPERLPDLSAATGERPAQPVRLEARSRPWWPWLLLLAGGIGMLLLIAFYPRMCERREVWVPLSEGDLRRRAVGLRRAACTLGAGGAALVLGIVGLPIGSSSPESWIVGLLVAGSVLLLVGYLGTDRWGRHVRLVLRDGGREVVLHDVDAAFVDELSRRWQ